MNIELVVFDMAGTTVADNGNVNDSFRHAFASEGIIVNAADINKVMGYRKIEAVKTILAKYAPYLADSLNETIHRIHDRFTEDMVFFYLNDTDLKPLPFAEDLFQLLQSKGIKVALNTGFTRVITDAILTRLGWNKNPFINQVICSDEVPEGRPHAYMIQSIMRQLGISTVKNVAKVGDTEVDVLEGRNAGCGMVVSVTSGAYSREELIQYSPDFIIDSLQEFPALIQ
ncbi:MAG: HAD hydrolase-like protein [Sediminibacterium sp.]|nr:HAD hydrolase-like protein [Sediminibacterium sp.]MDP1810327.1 HAD hydrolase-like protein [Sediminibacterium sp.]MDP3128499.1 HAD hydrolase-like protein [Sediminibacterium sp.]MDP3666987.1 HAD hydrolase-like protein [Sediminibacterium sp.]